MPDDVLRIGVLGDSHGNRVSLESALAQLNPIEMLFHLGDYYRDSEWLTSQAGVPVIGVVGNCDNRRHPHTEIFTLGTHRILVTHGHLQGVKGGTSKLIQEAKLSRATVVLYGHTHVPWTFRQNEIVFVNPGSTHANRRGPAQTCALVVLKGPIVEVTHFGL